MEEGVLNAEAFVALFSLLLALALTFNVALLALLALLALHRPSHALPTPFRALLGRFQVQFCGWPKHELLALACVSQLLTACLHHALVLRLYHSRDGFLPPPVSSCSELVLVELAAYVFPTWTRLLVVAVLSVEAAEVCWRFGRGTLTRLAWALAGLAALYAYGVVPPVFFLLYLHAATEPCYPGETVLRYTELASQGRAMAVLTYVLPSMLLFAALLALVIARASHKSKRASSFTSALTASSSSTVWKISRPPSPAGIHTKDTGMNRRWADLSGLDGSLENRGKTGTNCKRPGHKERWGKGAGFPDNGEVTEGGRKEAGRDSHDSGSGQEQAAAFPWDVTGAAVLLVALEVVFCARQLLYWEQRDGGPLSRRQWILLWAADRLLSLLALVLVPCCSLLDPQVRGVFRCCSKASSSSDVTRTSASSSDVTRTWPTLSTRAPERKEKAVTEKVEGQGRRSQHLALVEEWVRAGQAATRTDWEGLQDNTRSSPYSSPQRVEWAGLQDSTQSSPAHSSPQHTSENSGWAGQQGSTQASPYSVSQANSQSSPYNVSQANSQSSPYNVSQGHSQSSPSYRAAQLATSERSGWEASPFNTQSSPPYSASQHASRSPLSKQGGREDWEKSDEWSSRWSGKRERRRGSNNDDWNDSPPHPEGKPSRPLVPRRPPVPERPALQPAPRGPPQTTQAARHAAIGQRSLPSQVAAVKRERAREARHGQGRGEENDSRWEDLGREDVLYETQTRMAEGPRTDGHSHRTQSQDTGRSAGEGRRNGGKTEGWPRENRPADFTAVPGEGIGPCNPDREDDRDPYTNIREMRGPIQNSGHDKQSKDYGPQGKQRDGQLSQGQLAYTANQDHPWRWTPEQQGSEEGHTPGVGLTRGTDTHDSPPGRGRGFPVARRGVQTVRYPDTPAGGENSPPWSRSRKGHSRPQHNSPPDVWPGPHNHRDRGQGEGLQTETGGRARRDRQGLQDTRQARQSTVSQGRESDRESNQVRQLKAPQGRRDDRGHQAAQHAAWQGRGDDRQGHRTGQQTATEEEGRWEDRVLARGRFGNATTAGQQPPRPDGRRHPDFRGIQGPEDPVYQQHPRQQQSQQPRASQRRDRDTSKPADQRRPDMPTPVQPSARSSQAGHVSPPDQDHQAPLPFTFTQSGARLVHNGFASREGTDGEPVRIGRYGDGTVTGRYADGTGMAGHYGNTEMAGRYGHTEMAGRYGHTEMAGRYSNTEMAGRYGNTEMAGRYGNTEMAGRYGDGTGMAGYYGDGTGMGGRYNDGTGMAGRNSDGTGTAGRYGDRTGMVGRYGDGTGMAERYGDGTRITGRFGDGTGRAGRHVDGTGMAGRYGDGQSQSLGNFAGYQPESQC